ncbi:hypothetical protein [Herbaspirillum huttiense]|uniref:Uncharacterized protein n=1 Tax=Herbaspirillum huttiense subsp. lycopersici TaxID=3074428 RepID=A0ABU2ESI4_9BURK|nr:hypothetical protein [Herbaspirillum huttiense]MDR9850773.1 hypothetical protein [Herbaspirillum huttiense SE1]
MLDKFDWNDKDTVVVQRVDAIAVYQNEKGDLVIRQQDSMSDHDHYIIIPPDRVFDSPQLLERFSVQWR